MSNLYTIKVFGIACLTIVSGCAPPPKVVVEERTVLTVKQQTEKIGGQLIRTVKAGDTLHAIAFEYNLDIRQLAAWNNISDFSRVFIGQRLRLTKPPGTVLANSRPVLKSPESKESKNRTKPSSKVNKLSAQKKQSSRPSSSGTVKKGIEKKPTNTQVINWAWPLNGRVIRRFSPSNTQQGIDIAHSIGTSVVASAPGEVVYVGNSLKGYGNLIIIKHNENFLSAYAHNQKILVSEGQNVRRAERIGFVGTNSKGELALHFQIRFNGKPVNPLNYLPKR